MAEADFTQIAVGPQPVQVCPPLGAGSTVTLYNSDLTNIVTVSRNNSVAQNASNGAPIQPLTSAVMSAAKALYAVAPKGTAPLVIIPDGGTLSPSPAQIAAQISALGLATEATQLDVKGNTGDTVTVLGAPAQDPTVSGLNTGIPNNIAGTGAPLLALSTQWTNSSFPFSPGQSRSIGPVAFGQISYEALFTFVCGAGDTNPSFTVQFQWEDAATNLTIATETWYPCSGTTPGNTYQGSGRAKGSRLFLVITNNGSTSGTASIVLNQTSRVYVRDDLRSLVYNGIPSVPNGGYDPTANFLLETAPTVGTSSPVQRSIALYCGTVRLEGFTTLGPASFQIFTQNPNGLTNNSVWTGNITGSGQGTFNQQLDLPRYQCVLSIANQHTASQQIGVSIFVSEQNI